MDGEAEDKRDSLDFTPQMALDDVQKDINGAWKDRPPSKALFILLWDDEPNQYSTSFFNAGMKSSECIALLEKIKHDFLRLLSGEGAD